MDLRGQRVLVFGDSLTQRGSVEQVNVTETPNRASSAPGDLLASWLLASGAQAARLDARSGRSAINFWDREATAQLLAADAAWKPTLVIVALGTNDIGRDVVRTTLAMTKIRDAYQAMGARVIAIGPPSFTRADLQNSSGTVVALLQQVFGKANVIDARPLSADLVGSKFRTSDQVHFTREGAAVLAQRYAGAVMRLNSVREKLAKLKPLGIGLGASLGLGLVGFGLLWISKRRTKLLAGALHGDEPLFNAEEFFSYLPDPPEDVEGEYGWKEPDEDDWKDAYPAKGSRYRTRWLADEGHMVWLTWDQVHAMQGNQFDGGKVAALVEAIKRGGATLEPPIASLSIVTKDDVRESQEAAERDELFDSYGTTRPYDEDDIGKITVQLRDGNHRAFAAQIAGEHGLWAYIPDSKMADAKAVLKKLKKARKVKLEGAKRRKEIEEERVDPVVDVASRAIAPFFGVQPYDSETFSERLKEAKENPKLFKATAERVAETAKAIAREGGAWGGRKVFISDIAKRLGVPTKSIAGPLLIANNRGWLELSRADLTAAMDEQKVRASEIESPMESRYHFVVVG